MQLTQARVQELVLPANKTDHIVFDDECPGLGVRVRLGGSRTWVYQYQIGPRKARITLGRLSALTLAQARKRWGELHARVRLGESPAAIKAERQRQAEETLGAALRPFLLYQRSRVKPRSYVEVERHLLKGCRALHGLPLSGVGRRVVAARLAAIASNGGPVQANRTRASLHKFFNWCISEGLADRNPVAGTIRRPERARSRVLSGAEIAAVWKATADTTDFSAIVRLLLLTGCRASEIGGLRWSEVFTDRIVLPGERTKNSRPHTVPLTAPIAAILDARPRRPGRDHVFGRIDGRGFSGWSAGKVELDSRLQPAAPWTVHDLRRSVTTHMAEHLGVAPHLIESVLNHVSGVRGGVHAVYNQSAYEPQVRHVMTAWAEYLMALVEGRAPTSKVLQLMNHLRRVSGPPDASTSARP
jgi:integrase